MTAGQLQPGARFVCEGVQFTADRHLTYVTARRVAVPVLAAYVDGDDTPRFIASDTEVVCLQD